MTIIAGSVVGLLGVTGWQGFAAYVASQLLVRAAAAAQLGVGLNRLEQQGPLGLTRSEWDRAPLGSNQFN